MYTCNQDVLNEILALIDRGKCRQALSLWVKHRHADTNACPDCGYTSVQTPDRCCLCLESKLRTMSLYSHTPATREDGLLNAARKMSHHRQTIPQRATR